MKADVRDVLMDDDIASALAAAGASLHIDSLGYPALRIDGVRWRLHRFVMQPPPGFEVDHISRNKLDCRRENLRLATHQENGRNSKMRSHNKSGYRGVYLCKATGRWRAEIRFKGRAQKLGRFDAKEAAAEAYDEAAVRLHGEYAVTNRSLGLLP